MFAPVPMEIPLISDIQESLSEVTKRTSHLRKRIGEIYAIYILAYLTTLFSPYIFDEIICHRSTLPFTLAFSNVPGL